MSTSNRHQFYLPGALSAKLDALAAKPGASKTAILTEALTAWLERGAAHQFDGSFGMRLDRLGRSADLVECKVDELAETIGLLVRFQLTMAAQELALDGEARRHVQLRCDEFEKEFGSLATRTAAGHHARGRRQQEETDDGEFGQPGR